MTSGCGGTPALNKNRMNQELSSFAACLGDLISNRQSATCSRFIGIGNWQFSELALELFALQYQHNPAYQTICQARNATPKTVGDWTRIPAVPTTAFKELELSCIPPGERTAAFHSSGTTEQKPSRHFHCAESLKLYEASLWSWFAPNVLAGSKSKIQSLKLICLSPPPEQAPHSSLVHMFETVRSRACESADQSFFGMSATDGAWVLDFDGVTTALKSAIGNRQPAILLGTAFSFVHLLDVLIERNLHFHLPAGSLAMETGGYKNRSRTMPKDELHELITDRLGIPVENIVCEYGMSELSSQAYDFIIHHPPSILHPRIFRFPPWARVQIVSPETGHEVADGEIGLIRVFDLANVFSVMSVQTEDLGIQHDDGFELIGRAQLAERRGCSLMNA
jgi:hypothetical protein